jgi:hypothetical protein
VFTKTARSSYYIYHCLLSSPQLTLSHPLKFVDARTTLIMDFAQLQNSTVAHLKRHIVDESVLEARCPLDHGKHSFQLPADASLGALDALQIRPHARLPSSQQDSHEARRLLARVSQDHHQRSERAAHGRRDGRAPHLHHQQSIRRAM